MDRVWASEFALPDGTCTGKQVAAPKETSAPGNKKKTSNEPGYLDYLISQVPYVLVRPTPQLQKSEILNCFVTFAEQFIFSTLLDLLQNSLHSQVNAVKFASQHSCSAS